MEQNLSAGELLAAAGIPQDQVLRYQSDRDIAVIRAHRPLLWRYRRAQCEALKEQRCRLACLDRLIAQLAGADGT